MNDAEFPNQDELRSGAVKPPDGAPHRRRKESLPANLAQAVAWGAGLEIVAPWLDWADDADGNCPDA
jgi:hypothetical protein